ncbi:MAG: GNAT family N-acetyltransferase [Acidobacteria bacterium]|nr:GNAT family N-acetyltransferase [Acidobacteriota bacterium]
MNLILRAGRPADAARTGEICYEAFRAIARQHNFPEDFPNAEVATGLMTMLLNNPDVYSVVAETDGEIVGSNYLWEGSQVSGVGPITIDPRAQNAAIGRRLMEDVIRRSDERGFLSVRLVQAAYHNRSLALYTKLGFDPVEPLSVINGAPLRVAIEGFAVRPLTADDFAACDDLAFRVHGHTRRGDLPAGLAPGAGLVVERGGRITGYTTGLSYFGHTVAETNEDLKALIGAADSFPGAGFLLPTRNAAVLRWCLDNGLRIIQPLTLMSRGIYQEPRGAFLASILY